MKKVCISKDWTFSLADRSEQMQVDLPHDYLISLPRNPKSDGGASLGFFDGKGGDYFKYITFEDAEHVILDVDGAYMCARVSLNEHQLIMHPHGYTPFLVDLTPKMRKGRINKLEISTQNLEPSTRWYSGAGLYRDVFVWTGGKVRIEPWDLFITTQSISKQQATVSAAMEIAADLTATVLIKTEIRDPAGATVVAKTTEVSVTPGKNSLELVYEIQAPQLWNIDTPDLYTMNIQILLDGNCEDTAEQTFGIRTVSADAQNGLLINGKSVKLQGGCIHHDHGGLGAPAFPAAIYRKLSKLKEAGFNAVRIAHNPPSLALLEICDRLGLFVMDEAFDMWVMPKKRLDYSLWFADWWTRDIASMVLRDRSHPCVISYSIGNEVKERAGTSDGAEWSRKLSAEIRKYDTTRLVTSGICRMYKKCESTAPQQYQEDYLEGYPDIGDRELGSSWDKRTEKVMAPLDIVGYNYLYGRYEYDHQNYPERVIWGSETHALDFYHSWQAVLRNSYVIGDFTWTAYDNLGEAGTGRFIWERDGFIPGISLGKYPWRSCYQGDLDLCGYRRPQSYFRESIWRENCEPRIFTTHPEHFGEGFSGTKWHWYDVHDSWTFDDEYIGKPVKAEVYTDAEEIHFILNGTEKAIAKPADGIAEAVIPYEKGTLTAIAYKGGKKVGKSSLHTVGAPQKICVTAEKELLLADNRDLCYFEITVADENGHRIPHGKQELCCICDGGELLAIFSGNPANEDQYTSDRCHAFEGRAIAIVRTKEPGKVTVTVGSKGLRSGTATVEAKE